MLKGHKFLQPGLKLIRKSIRPIKIKTKREKELQGKANQTHQAQVKLPERKGLTGRESRSAEPKKMLTRTSQIPSLQNTSSPWKSNW